MLKFSNQFKVTIAAVLVAFGFALVGTQSYRMQKQLDRVEKMQTVVAPSVPLTMTPTATPSATPTLAVKGVYRVSTVTPTK